MGRQSKGMYRRSHSPKHVGRLVLIAAVFALFLTSTTAFSQDPTPPPPPPDNQSALSSGPGAQEQSTVRAVSLSRSATLSAGEPRHAAGGLRER